MDGLARTLLWIARQSAPSHGIDVLPGGWIPSKELFVKVPSFARGLYKDVDRETIEQVINGDRNNRLQITDSLADGSWQIRATTAHTFDVVDDGTLYPVLDVTSGMSGLYLTRPGAFRRIKKAGSVNCMRRVHIHLTPMDEPKGEIPDDLTIAIEFDITAANRDENITFLKGSNGRILTRGNHLGGLSLAYCKSVWIRYGDDWVQYDKESVPFPKPVRNRRRY